MAKKNIICDNCAYNFSGQCTKKTRVIVKGRREIETIFEKANKVKCDDVQPIV